MKIVLSDEEFARLSRYIGQIENIRKQIEQLRIHGNEVLDILKVCWRDANRRVKLENPEFRDIDIPEIVNEQGQQVIALNAKDRTAEWQSVHDLKRIGNNGFQKKCDEEKTDDTDNRQ